MNDKKMTPARALAPKFNATTMTRPNVPPSRRAFRFYRLLSPPPRAAMAFAALSENERLFLGHSRLGDEGLAALLFLTKLKVLSLAYTQVSDAGCATLSAALDSGMLPALERLFLTGTPASAAAKEAVRLGRAGLMVYKQYTSRKRGSRVGKKASTACV